jgi:hypothetical protein
MRFSRWGEKVNKKRNKTTIMMDEEETKEILEVVYITSALKTGNITHTNIPELVQSTAHI